MSFTLIVGSVPRIVSSTTVVDHGCITDDQLRKLADCSLNSPCITVVCLRTSHDELSRLSEISSISDERINAWTYLLAEITILISEGHVITFGRKHSSTRRWRADDTYTLERNPLANFRSSVLRRIEMSPMLFRRKNDGLVLDPTLKSYVNEGDLYLRTRDDVSSMTVGRLSIMASIFTMSMYGSRLIS